ncbi:MAG: arginyltransferase [Campylobacter sp.]|nr:arginyltransferase [Campylobacter sp.]
MRSVIPFCSLDSKCPYLDAHESRTEYLYIDGCSSELNSELIKRGYRRFGRYFQRPVCNGCQKCVSIRIDTFNFSPSKSQRRLMRKNSQTKFYYSRPIADLEHVELFKKYHKYMYFKRDWKYYDIDLMKYYDLYVLGYENFGKEISYYIDGNLVCVDLIDIVDDGISSIYCYYDPEFSHLSLGKFSLLKEIELAKELDLHWIYLGYHVKGCQSLEYKSDFKPLERLEEYVELIEIPKWIEFND